MSHHGEAVKDDDEVLMVGTNFRVSITRSNDLENR